MATNDRLLQALEALDHEESPNDSADTFSPSFDSVFLADFARCITVAECISGDAATAKHVVIDSWTPIHHDWEKLKELPSEVDHRAQSASVALALRAHEEQPDLPNEFAPGAHPGRRLEDPVLAGISELVPIQRAIVAVSFVFGGTQEHLAELVGKRQGSFLREYREALSHLHGALGESGSDPAALARAFRSRTHRHDVNDDRFLLLSAIRAASPGDPQSGVYRGPEHRWFRRR